MKTCYICSRYADPDPDPVNRRRNLAEARALARWAEAHGFAAVTWWGSIDPENPPCDSDEARREAALNRSAELAYVVGLQFGYVVIPTWYRRTDGMDRDLAAYERGLGHSWRGPEALFLLWDEVEPYYIAPGEVEKNEQ